MRSSTPSSSCERRARMRSASAFRRGSTRVPAWRSAPSTRRSATSCSRTCSRSRIGLPVGVINDGSAAALAEFLHGAGRGTRDLVLLTLGTGVGGGLILDGQLYRGWSEVGHMVIVEDGEPCQGACTGHGHVESYCSGNAADRLAREVLGRGRRHTTSSSSATRRSVGSGAHLGAAVSSLVNLFDPDVVVIGGGFGVAAGALLLDPVREVMAQEALAPAGTTVRLAVAELGSSAGVIGAGLLAFEALG